MQPHKEVWALWDKAWNLNLPAAERLAILQDIAAPNFNYSNPVGVITEGNLDELTQFIDKLLAAYDNSITVKHHNWWEHHLQSAAHWDMIDTNTGQATVHGFSYARYTEEGRLLSVTDFW